MINAKKLLLCAAVAAILPVLSGTSASAAPSTIAGIYTTGPGTYTDTATVSAILNVSASANTFVMQDGTGSIIAFGVAKSTYTATLGDSISFNATDVTYQGSPELSSSGFTLNGLPTPGTAPSPTVLTIPQFKATGDGTATAFAPYAESLVELDNVTISPTTAFPGASANATYTLSDGTNTTSLYAYKSDSAVVAAETAANAANPGGLTGTYDIVGYDDVFYGAPEIYPLSIVAVPEPASITLLALGGISMLARRRRMA